MTIVRRHMSGEEKIKNSGLESHEFSRKNVTSLQRAAATNLTRDYQSTAYRLRRVGGES